MESIEQRRRGRNSLVIVARDAADTADRGAHEVLDLPFQPAKLKGLSVTMLSSHHANNHYSYSICSSTRMRWTMDPRTRSIGRLWRRRR